LPYIAECLGCLRRTCSESTPMFRAAEENPSFRSWSARGRASIVTRLFQPLSAGCTFQP